jgi:hypothetical protein
MLKKVLGTNTPVVTVITLQFATTQQIIYLLSPCIPCIPKKQQLKRKRLDK